MPTCSEVESQLGAYALRALESGEVRDVERHLSSCADCRMLAESDLATVGELALAPLQVKPPPHLRARLIAAARADRSEPVRRWRPAWGSATPAALGAAAVASLAFAVTFGWAVTLQARPPIVTTVIVSSPSDYPTDWSLAGAQMHRLAGSEVAPEARGWIYADPSGGEALLIAYRLPPLPSGRVYQLWLDKGGGERHSGGMFNVDAEGYGWLKVRASSHFGAFQRVGITVEPGTGSSGPTGARVLGGEL